MKRLAAVPLAILHLSACDAGPAADAGVSVVDSAGVQVVVSDAPLWSAEDSWRLGSAPRVEIGALDAEPEYLFDRVMGAVRLPDGRVVVADMGSSQLRFFDPAGRHLMSVGGSGGGPGEFRQITALHRLPEDLLGVEDRRERVHFFAPDGRYLDVLRTGAMPMDIDPVSFHVDPPQTVRIVGWPGDGTFIGRESSQVTLSATRQFEEAQTLETVFSRFGEDGTATDELVRVPGATFHPHPFNLTLPAVFGARVLSATTDDALVLGFSGSGEVHWYGLDGALERIARRPWADRPVTSDMIEEYVRGSSPPLREDIARDRTFAEELPAFSGLVVDRTGNVWLREYHVSHAATTLQYQRTYEEPTSWSVFGPSGRWHGEVVMPARFSVLEIGEDYVLGMRRDEFDVEYVQLFDLIKPGRP